jgi:hypothetical protein
MDYLVYGPLGEWTFPVKDNQWQAVALTHDLSPSTNEPQARVNFVDVTMMRVHAPDGNPEPFPAGYCVGNDTAMEKTWNGRIAHVQVFNRILTASEQDACLREPGSVTNGLRLWLPMSHATDINDRSVNRFHATATDLATGASGPATFTRPLGAPMGITYLTPGILPVAQHVIPRYADGTNHPAGQLRGMGTVSAIQGMTYGLPDGSNPQVIITTEGYGTAMNQWDYNNPDNAEAVLQPVVRDISILGHDDTNDGYQNTGGTVVNSDVFKNPFFPHGDAIVFNGTSSPSGGTSKLVDTDADVLAGSKKVTVCCWVHPDGLGENTLGYILVLDALDGNKAFILSHMTTSHQLAIFKKPGASGTTGSWTFPITDGVWNAVCVRLDFSGDYAPTARVNFKKVTPAQFTAPVGVDDDPAVGYCVGNQNAQNNTWQGRIAQVQVFNAILTDGEADSALIAPGSVATNRRLWLPMTNKNDTNDASGLNFHGVGTDLDTGPNFKDREIGLAVQASGPHIENVGIFHIAGTACFIKRGFGDLFGPIQPFDREFATLKDLSFYRAYRGISIDVIDTEVGNIEAEYLRDYGVQVTSGDAKFNGAVHVSGVSSGVAPAVYGTAVWFRDDAGPSWGSGPWYCETSDVGMRIDSSGNKITNFYSKGCKYRNLWFDWPSRRNSVSNFEIDEIEPGITTNNGGEAVLMAGHSNMLAKGTIGGGDAVPSGEIAIRITNGNRQTIRDVDFLGTTGSSAPLISVNCSGFVPLTDSIIIAKCVNAGTFLDLHPIYTSGTARAGAANNEIRLAASKVFLDDELEGMTVMIITGTGSSPQQSRTISSYSRSTNTATVSSNWTTNPGSDSVYEIRTGIGVRNHIRLTSTGNVTKRINLPPTWDESNDMTVDGLKLRGSITNVSAANPAVITSPGHGLSTNDTIAIAGVVGQPGVNSAPGQVHAVSNVTNDTFTVPVDTTGGSSYEKGTGWWGDWVAR